MTPANPRVVLDTVVFVQALISGRGSAARCLERLRAGQFILFLSDDLLREMRDVPLRQELVRKYSNLTAERVNAFIQDMESRALVVRSPLRAFTLPRDPKDEPLIDLAVAGNAEFVVTWNERHLTYLMKQDTPEGKDFCARFPTIHIMSPPQFLAELDARRRT